LLFGLPAIFHISWDLQYKVGSPSLSYGVIKSRRKKARGSKSASRTTYDGLRFHQTQARCT